MLMQLQRVFEICARECALEQHGETVDHFYLTAIMQVISGGSLHDVDDDIRVYGELVD